VIVIGEQSYEENLLIEYSMNNTELLKRGTKRSCKEYRTQFLESPQGKKCGLEKAPVVEFLSQKKA
jgi:hypothetical protein